MKAQRRSRYEILLFFLTLALHVVGGQLHAPAALASGTNRYLLYTRQGGHQGLSGRVRKI